MQYPCIVSKYLIHSRARGSEKLHTHENPQEVRSIVLSSNPYLRRLVLTPRQDMLSKKMLLPHRGRRYGSTTEALQELTMPVCAGMLSLQIA